MTTTPSVRLDTATMKRLEALARRARRSKSFLAAEAIAAFVDAESWQLDEIHAGVNELDGGRGVAHKRVATWLHQTLRVMPAMAARIAQQAWSIQEIVELAEPASLLEAA